MLLLFFLLQWEEEKVWNQLEKEGVWMDLQYKLTRGNQLSLCRRRRGNTNKHEAFVPFN